MPKRKGTYSNGGRGKIVSYKHTSPYRRKGYVPRLVNIQPFYGRKTSVGEKKFHDIDVDDTTIAAAGSILNTGTLLIIAEGNGEEQRIGRKITITNIHVRAKVTLPGATGATLTSAMVRVIMYMDTQCNGATAAVTDILETADFQSFMNLSNSRRFVTIFDKNFNLHVSGAAASAAAFVFGEDSRFFQFHKQCSIPIEYDNSVSSGALTSIRSNNIGILVISSDDEVGAWESKVRFRYTDH